MKLVVAYSPELDGQKQEGIWDIDNNRVALSWRLFSDFRKEKDNNKRRMLLESVRTVSGYQLQ